MPQQDACSARVMLMSHKKDKERPMLGSMTAMGNWRISLVGACALMVIDGVGARADEDKTSPQTQTSRVVAVASIESQIAQAKATLRLTAAQERHWPRVASTLRSIAHQSTQANRTTSQTAAATRVLAAAAPLIRTLDAEQKERALHWVRAMGYGHLASRL